MFRFGLKMAIVGLLLSPSLAQAQKANATPSVSSTNITVVGKGTRPKWSSDGSHIVYLSSGKLISYSVGDSSSVEICDYSLPHFYWADSVTIVVIRKVEGPNSHITKTFAVESYSPQGSLISTQEFPATPGTRGDIQGRRSSTGRLRIQDSRQIGENTFLSLKSSLTARASVSDTEVFVVSTRYFHFAERWNIPFGSDIWTVNSNGDPIHLIAKAPPTNDFMSPVLSPNGKLVLFSDGVGTRLYSIKGDSIGYVANATYSTWIPNSTSFVFTAISDDGYDLTSSDIFVSDSSGMQVKQITVSPNKIELYATQSVGNHIAYSDYNSGAVEILKVH